MAGRESGTAQLFVGANNETKELEVDLLKKVLSNRHAGYTIQYGEGVWMRQAEPMAIVTIFDEKLVIKETIQTLKVELDQLEVGVLWHAPMEFL